MARQNERRPTPSSVTTHCLVVPARANRCASRKGSPTSIAMRTMPVRSSRVPITSRDEAMDIAIALRWKAMAATIPKSIAVVDEMNRMNTL